MGEPVGKASGRTFNRISTCLPDPCWSSLFVKSSIPLRMSIWPPSEVLESGLPVSVYATMKLIQHLLVFKPTVEEIIARTCKNLKMIKTNSLSRGFPRGSEMDWDLTCGISIPAGEAKAAKNLSTDSAASIEFKGMEKGDVIHFIRNRTMSDATSLPCTIWAYEKERKSAFYSSEAFASNFRQRIPEARWTIRQGISRDLKPKAWHPLGNSLSQVIKK